MAGYKVDRGVPFLSDDSGKVVGYIADDGKEYALDGSLLNKDNLDPVAAINERLHVLRLDPDMAASDDSYDHISSVLEQAKIISASGVAVIVSIPPLTFKTSSMIEIPDGVGIVGEHPYNSAIDVSQTDGETALIACRTNKTIVKSIRIIGGGKGSQPSNGSNLTSEEVISRSKSSGSGIVFAGVSGGVISNCTIENCGGTSGVAPYNGVAGIWLTNGCSDCVINYNSIYNCRNGINEDNFYSGSPVNNKILNNFIEQCRFGIAVEGYYVAGDVNSKGCVIAFNTVKNCVQSGIDLNKTQRAFVGYNYIEGCGYDSGNSGIWLYGTSSIPAFDNEIVGNKVFGCGQSGIGGSGIKVGPYVYYAQVNNNSAIENYGDGVLIIGQCRYWSVDGGHFRGNKNGVNAYRVDGSNVVTTGSISGATILLNMQNGVLLDGASEIIVSCNQIKANSQQASNTYDGIRLTNGATLNKIVGNKVSGGSDRYSVVCTDSGSQGNEFINNSFASQATGRFGFSSLNQSWKGNDDPDPTSSGNPSGNYPYGTSIFNPVDSRLYIKKPSGWVSVGLA